MPDNRRNESRHSMPGNRRKKTAEYRGEQNIRKRRDVDVRNGRGMVAGLTRKWASTTPVPMEGGKSGLAGSLFWFGGYFTG